MKKGKGWLPKKEYDFIFERSPRLCIDLVVRTRNGILLSKRSIRPFKGLWHLPGGRVRYRERLEQAMQRIAKEEISTNVTVKKFLGAIEILRDGPRFHSISLAFLVTPKGKFSSSSPQSEQTSPFRDLPPHLHPYHASFLRSRKKELGFMT